MELIKKFGMISITGRYIYAYICLKKALAYNKCQLPDFLDELMRAYPSIEQKVTWHERAQEVLPSFVLADGSWEDYKVTSQKQVDELQTFYSLNPLLSEIIEDVFWIGFANMYGKFQSDITVRNLENVLMKIKLLEIEPPRFEIISSCSVKENHGWGNTITMDQFDRLAT